MINNGEPLRIEVGGWIDREDMIWEGPWDDRKGTHRGCGGELYDAFYEGGGTKCRKCAGWHCI